MDKSKLITPSMDDITRTAKVLVDRYGADACEHALKRVEELQQDQDVKGAGVWLAVLHDVKHLLGYNKDRLV